jgi:hypothetical protein
MTQIKMKGSSNFRDEGRENATVKNSGRAKGEAASGCEGQKTEDAGN